MLDKEFKYYKEHQDELVQKHYARYIIIKDETVYGDFDSEVGAIQHARKELKFELGTFLVQHCLPGTENYTQLFHSRVLFR